MRSVTTVAMTSRYERVARNEARFRETNERVAAWSERAGTFPAETIEFYCECGDSTCFERLSLTRAQYEAVRAGSDRFAVLMGHVVPGAERVVEDHGSYVVVRKASDLRRIVEQTDPRRERQ